MSRAFFPALLFAAIAGSSTLSAAEEYRICLRNSAGQISLPDESGRAKKTYFLHLEMLTRSGSRQYFGGAGERFQALTYDSGRKVLTCEEVETRRRFALEMGKWINFLELPR